MNDINGKQTADCIDKRQFDKKIIDEIIKILASNNLTIEEAKNILHNTIKGIERQKVSISQ